jgi:CRP-like cAMP-binding protein
VKTYQQKIDDLLKVLPFRAERDLIEAIVFHSSQIDFEGVGEKLFKQGDKPLGFYWILSGAVDVVVPEKAMINLKSGYMAGLDCFLNHNRHPFNISTATPVVKTLFINRACFEDFNARPHFRQLINRQVLFHLASYKSLLYSPVELLLK